MMREILIFFNNEVICYTFLNVFFKNEGKKESFYLFADITIELACHNIQNQSKDIIIDFEIEKICIEMSQHAQNTQQ